MLLIAINHPELAPLRVSDRFRQQLPYFMTPGGDTGVPALSAGEYWVRLDEARRWLDEGCISVVSPLSAETKAEIELTEEQEEFLEWLVAHQIEHVRTAVE
jgi:hypothetical protein